MVKRKGKAMYSLVVRTNLDELPIGLYGRRSNALRAAVTLTRERIREAAEFMDVDDAGLVVSAIIEYRDGLPVKLDLLELPDTVMEAAT